MLPSEMSCVVILWKFHRVLPRGNSFFRIHAHHTVHGSPSVFPVTPLNNNSPFQSVTDLCVSHRSIGFSRFDRDYAGVKTFYIYRKYITNTVHAYPALLIVIANNNNSHSGSYSYFNRSRKISYIFMHLNTIQFACCIYSISILYTL